MLGRALCLVRPGPDMRVLYFNPPLTLPLAAAMACTMPLYKALNEPVAGSPSFRIPRVAHILKAHRTERNGTRRYGI